MTPRKLTEKIFRMWIDIDYPEFKNTSFEMKCVDQAESLLTSALEEARLQANEETMLNYGKEHERQKLGMRQTVEMEYRLKIEEARAAAYEECAKIIDEDDLAEYGKAGGYLSKKIRQLAKE